MNGKIGNTEQDERGLLPYPVIIAATKGDPDAMAIVLRSRLMRAVLSFKI